MRTRTDTKQHVRVERLCQKKRLRHELNVWKDCVEIKKVAISTRCSSILPIVRVVVRRTANQIQMMLLESLSPRN